MKRDLLVLVVMDDSENNFGPFLMPKKKCGTIKFIFYETFLAASIFETECVQRTRLALSFFNKPPEEKIAWQEQRKPGRGQLYPGFKA